MPFLRAFASQIVLVLKLFSTSKAINSRKWSKRWKLWDNERAQIYWRGHWTSESAGGWTGRAAGQRGGEKTQQVHRAGSHFRDHHAGCHPHHYWNILPSRSLNFKFKLCLKLSHLNRLILTNRSIKKFNFKKNFWRLNRHFECGLQSFPVIFFPDCIFNFI